MPTALSPHTILPAPRLDARGSRTPRRRTPRRTSRERTVRVRPPRVPEMPGLDGVRALAVMAVFAYHAEVAWLPGGFLGVDVFFVLSGYLITALLVTEFERTRTIDLVGFWRRRVRRLLPALVVVVAGTVAVASLAAPGQLPALAGDALAALTNWANWHEIAGHHSYFSQFGRPPLMRQLWSLSVEEQFYLVWPPLLLLAARGGGRRRVALVATALAVASTVEMLVLAHTGSPTRLYEGTDTRAATLLVGAVAAVVLAPQRLRSLAARTAPVVFDAVGVACLVGLGWLMGTAHATGRGLFDGQLSLASLLAVGLVVAAAQPAGLLRRPLQSRPLRFVGRRSYGIYLIHWPVVALTRSPNAAFGQSASLTLIQAAITLSLAVLMYRWIETPIRRDGLRATLGALDRRLRRRPALRWGAFGLVSAALVAGAIGCLSALTPGSPATRGTAAALHLPPTVGPAPRPPVAPVIHPSRAPATHRPASLRHTPVALFGDSEEIDIDPPLARALHATLTLDAVVGRQPQDTVAAVTQARRDGTLPARVVVALGDNGLVTAAMLDQLHDALRGVPDVVLVTPRVPEPWGPPSAAAIRAARRGWPTVRVADWAALSADRDDWFYDGVHTDPQGTRALVGLVVSTLRQR